MIDYNQKYLKYKLKYLQLKKNDSLIGGMEQTPEKLNTENKKIPKAPKKPKNISKFAFDWYYNKYNIYNNDIINLLTNPEKNNITELTKEIMKIFISNDQLTLIFLICDLRHDFRDKTITNYIKKLDIMNKIEQYNICKKEFDCKELIEQLNDKYLQNNKIKQNDKYYFSNGLHNLLTLTKTKKVIGSLYDNLNKNDVSLLDRNYIDPIKGKNYIANEMDGLYLIEEENNNFSHNFYFDKENNYELVDFLEKEINKIEIYRFLLEEWLNMINYELNILFSADIKNIIKFNVIMHLKEKIELIITDNDIPIISLDITKAGILYNCKNLFKDLKKIFFEKIDLETMQEMNKGINEEMQEMDEGMDEEMQEMNEGMDEEMNEGMDEEMQKMQEMHEGIDEEMQKMQKMQKMQEGIDEEMQKIQEETQEILKEDILDDNIINEFKEDIENKGLNIEMQISPIKFDEKKEETEKINKERINKNKKKRQENIKRIKIINIDLVKKLPDIVKNIILLCILSLKTFGDKSYEYLFVIFLIIHYKKSLEDIKEDKMEKYYNFRIASLDNILLVSLYSNIIAFIINHNNNIPENFINFTIETTLKKKHPRILNAQFKI